MASNLGQLVATATLDIAPFMTNTKNLKTYMKGLDNSLKTLNNSFKGQGSKLSNLRSLYDQTGHSLKGYQAVLAKQSDHFNKLKAEIGDVNQATSAQKAQLAGAQAAMTATAAQVANLENKYQALGKEIAIQSSAFTKFGTAAQAVGGRMTKVGESMSSVGASLTRGVTVPLVAGAGVAVRAAIKYESAFAGVKKTVDETATVSYAKLSKGIRQMSKELPASAVEIANVAEAAGQLGVPAGAILGFTKNMINLGESTNMSAEEAAMSIAKIGNVMGFTGNQLDDFSTQFGATVVRLGNNFATTESDVTAMTNRLAASGRIAGLTTPQIMGLATSMSSVGIEAEAGGTAMSQTLTNISKAVSEGGDELLIYADVAGMTADQFAESWRTKPAEALQAFIKGLGESEAKGRDVNKTLDDLGLTGIRQSNMLKSLGLAAGTMGEAMKMASEEWNSSLGETNALTEEAAKRYETTESKLKMLRNEVTDIAIEFGGPLVDAMRNGLEAARPWIDNLAKLAEKFNALDQEQQQSIIRWAMLAAATGPVLSGLGKVTSVAGTAITGVGKLSSALGKLHGSLKVAGTASSGLDAVATSTTKASTAAGVLSKAWALATNPVTLLVGGAAALAGGLVYLNHKQDEARRQAEEWGTALDGKTKSELEAFRGKVDETSLAMVKFDAQGSAALGNIKQSFSNLMAEISASHAKADANLEALGKRLGLSDAQIAEGKRKNAEIVSNAQAMTDQIKAIYERHNGDTSRLTAQEKAIVENNQRELVNAKLSLMDLSNKQEKAVRQAFNQDISQLNETQLGKTMASLEKALQAEKKAYKTQQADLKSALEAGMLTQEKYDAEKLQSRSQHEAAMNALGEKYAQAASARDAQMMTRTRDYTTNNRIHTEAAKKALDKLGLSYDDLANKVSTAAQRGGSGAELLAQSTAKMSSASKEANASWNAMVFDEKTGKVKTNAREEIQKAVSSQEGWNSMQFILKNANMTTNARMEVASALVENGRWNSMTPDEKKLVVDGKSGLMAIAESKTHLTTWNSMPAEVKEILGSNKDFISKKGMAETALNAWNSLSPAEKELKAKDMVSPVKIVAQNAIDSLMGKTVDLNARNKALGPKTEAQATMNSLQNVNRDLNATNKTAGPKANAQATMNSLQNVNRDLNATNKTAGPKASAQATMNSLQNVNRDLNATNKTAGPKANAQATMNSLQNVNRNLLATNLTAGPKASAQATMNSLQNVNRNLLATNLTAGPTASARGTMASLPNISRTITAVDNTGGGVARARGALASLYDKTVNIITNFIERRVKHEKGTNFHPGGLAVVNDQKGPLYRELVTLPSGRSFIPEGRDVVLPLPRGSKVLKASHTAKLFPRYANGIGFEDTKIASLTQRMGQISSHDTVLINQATSSDQGLLAEILQAIKSMSIDSQQNFTLNVTQQGTAVDNREALGRLLKEFGWYVQQQNGRMEA